MRPPRFYPTRKWATGEPAPSGPRAPRGNKSTLNCAHFPAKSREARPIVAGNLSQKKAAVSDRRKTLRTRQTRRHRREFDDDGGRKPPLAARNERAPFYFEGEALASGEDIAPI